MDCLYRLAIGDASKWFPAFLSPALSLSATPWTPITLRWDSLGFIYWLNMLGWVFAEVCWWIRYLSAVFPDTSNTCFRWFGVKKLSTSLLACFLFETIEYNDGQLRMKLNQIEKCDQFEQENLFGQKIDQRFLDRSYLWFLT